MEIEVLQFDKESKGFFKAVQGEQEAGRMTYSWAGTDKFIIDHTEVSAEFKGRSVGKKMLMQAVYFAREKQVSIIPLCPFAKSMFDKLIEIRDVL